VEKARDNPSLLLGETKKNIPKKVSTQDVAKRRSLGKKNIEKSRSCTQMWQKKNLIDSHGCNTNSVGRQMRLVLVNF